MALGYQFSPDQQSRLRNNLNSSINSPQGYQALKVLSLRMPNVLGGRPISPDDLLRPQPGGMGGGPSAVVGSNLRSPAPGGLPRASAGPAQSMPAGAPSGMSSGLPRATAGPAESTRLVDLINAAVADGGSPGAHFTPGGGAETPMPASPIEPPSAPVTPSTGGTPGVSEMLERLFGGGGKRFV